MIAPRLLVALPLAALAACVPPAPEPTPAPSPSPAARPEPAPSPAAPPAIFDGDDWMDAPQTPGDWSYGKLGAGGSVARFGTPGTEPRFAFTCLLPTRTVILARSGRAAASVAMQIRTESADRQLIASPRDEGTPTLQATLPAHDSLLDAIAFSKGRFAVQVEGLEPLFLPAWPEISRVIDDCR